jgi:transposase-like protein
MDALDIILEAAEAGEAADAEETMQVLPVTEDGKRRRRLSNREKLSMLRSIRRRTAEGESIRKVCLDLKIEPKQYRVWKNQAKAMAEKEANAHSIHSGPTSSLAPIAADLLQYIFELREQGAAVTIRLVSMKAAALSREMREKNKLARYQAVARWVQRQSLTYRMGTHVSQRHPSLTAKEALDFIESMRPILSQPNRHQDFIINMDQTPVYFDPDAKKTLDVIGKATIFIRKSCSDTKRATLGLSVTASGKFLTPMLIFKGATNGRIVKTEFKTYPSGIVYACQPAAWMDETAMINWVTRILKPYVESAPDGVVPLLLLDSYRCHMMGNVVKSIQEIGVEVQHIPGGCTSLCQPVDIGVNKPLKNKLKDHWESWMIAEGILTNTTSPPCRKQVAEWVKLAMGDVTTTSVFNSWRKTGYSYFPMTTTTMTTAPVL